MCPKTSTFRQYDVPTNIIEAVTDCGGVTDGSVIGRLANLTPENARIQLMVCKWKPAYQFFEKLPKGKRNPLGRKKARERLASLLEKTSRELQRLIPQLSADGLHISLESLTIAQEIRSWPSIPGRPAEWILGEYAEELIEAVKKVAEGRKTPWTKLGKITIDEFGVKLSDTEDAGRWLIGLVKRHRRTKKHLPARGERKKSGGQ